MLEVNNLFHATGIIEGYGVIETTGQECANLGFGKVLVITDPFLASSEHYKKLKKSLDDAKIENFLLTNVKPNPRAEDCDEMAEFAKKNHVDALIALGGGSAMDTVIILYIRQEQRRFSHLSYLWIKIAKQLL